MNWLRLLQPFHDYAPRCDWRGCPHWARGVYHRPGDSPLALCQDHIRELAESDQIDFGQDTHYPPHAAIFQEENNGHRCQKKA